MVKRAQNLENALVRSLVCAIFFKGKRAVLGIGSSVGWALMLKNFIRVTTHLMKIMGLEKVNASLVTKGRST